MSTSSVKHAIESFRRADNLVDLECARIKYLGKKVLPNYSDDERREIEDEFLKKLKKFEGR